jgi:hypothetical protein
MSVVVAITNKGIIVADSLVAAQRVADNAGHVITSTIVQTARDVAPIVEGVADANTLLDLTRAVNTHRARTFGRLLPQ